MAINKFKVAVAIISASFIGTSCFKGIVCSDAVTYSFNIYTQAHPDKDSIFVGDTIWLQINTPTVLKDSLSGQNIDYSGAENLASAIGIGQFFGIDSVVSAANNFNYYLISGKQINNPNIIQIREFQFLEQNNFFTFKLGVIPKVKGVFGIGFSDATNVNRSSDKCTKANFNIAFKNTNQHFYLNQNLKGDTALAKGSYYFKVI